MLGALFQLDDKRALVTGAATGLGQGIAVTLVREAPRWPSRISLARAWTAPPDKSPLSVAACLASTWTFATWIRSPAVSNG